MLRTPYFALFLVVLLAWAALHQLAIHLYWYWLFWWFDILMHTLGGFLVGLAGLMLCFHSPLARLTLLRRHPLLATVAGVAAVAVFWEFFEYRSGIIELPAELLDSTLDVLAGLSGGLLSYVLVARRPRFDRPA